VGTQFRNKRNLDFLNIRKYFIPVHKTTTDPVAAPSQALVCGHSLAGIVGSNLSDGVEFFRLWFFIILKKHTSA
jgi:hypothetical protein